MADPYAPYLKQAQDLFDAGDVVKAGQIWQAILKRMPDHETARAGLYKVKAHFDARATQDGLGGPAEPAAAPKPADRVTHTPPPAEINGLLDAGCALYDAGMVTKAVATWEAVLLQEPDNPLAKGYLEMARRKIEADEAAQAEAATAPDPDPVDKLLRDGCTLYDMGQAEDALRKWERVLDQEPGHALARAYANDARRDLGLPPLEAAPALAGVDPAEAAAPEPPADPPPPLQAAEEDLGRADRLVREGVQIYDLGMTDEAVAKWEQALALEPEHADAQGYLAMARRDRAQAPPSAAPAAPALPPAPAEPAPDPMEPRLQAAEHLLRNQKFEEAAYAFQRLMEIGYRDARVLHGYQQARAFIAAQEAAAAEPPAAVPATPAPVGPPRALTTRPAARAGLSAPAFLSGIKLPPWLERPRNMVLVSLGVLAAMIGLALYRSHQRDVALRDAVDAARAQAMAPVARKTQVVALNEQPQDIRKEAERALSDDPLTAYYRAQEVLRQDPADPAATQLLEKARGRMAAQPPVGSGADLDQAMKAGDLPTARNAVLDQLRQNPDDPDLKAKARTIYLALAQSLAAAEKFSDARDLLLQGRAMFPQDRTWYARLKLLEEIQGMAKGERAPWIPLLG